MPDRVARRYGALIEYLRGFPNAIDNAEVFRYWLADKDHLLWSKPLLMFAYRIEALPSDETLHDALRTLATVRNGAMAIT
jgi:hypothetical protein